MGNCRRVVVRARIAVKSRITEVDLDRETSQNEKTAAWSRSSSVVIGLLFLVSLGGIGCSGLRPSAVPTISDWKVAGQGLSDTRNQPAETIITATNVNALKVKWTFTTAGDVSATPTISGNTVFASDWAGNLFAIRKDTGQELWRHRISDYDGMKGSMSRVSALVVDGAVIIGDNVINQAVQHGGATIIAVDRSSGASKWATQVDDHPAAIITGSPTAFQKVIYVGIASNEETLAETPGYHCCTFRGSVVALDAETGRILWKTYTVPNNQGASNGFSGAAVWQPAALDSARRALYIGTGNNYTVPAEVEACESQAFLVQGLRSCTPLNDYVDSVMALDLMTGKVKWTRKMNSYDTWTLACLTPMTGVKCPSPTGPDYDFTGSGPNLLGNMVGFAQKSGVYWAFDPDNGNILWSTTVGPGSELGGILWGTASDGERIYIPVANQRKNSYTLAPDGPTITWGSWAALDVKTGNILWQTADPTPGATDMGAASVANGVVFAGSMSGMMYALDTHTGRVLWKFASGGSVLDGPAIVNGVVYWGSGYSRLGTGNNKIYAFDLAATK